MRFWIWSIESSAQAESEKWVGGTGHRVSILRDKPCKEMVDSDVSKCCSLRSSGLARQVVRPSALHSQSSCPPLVTGSGCRKGGALSLESLGGS